MSPTLSSDWAHSLESGVASLAKLTIAAVPAQQVAKVLSLVKDKSAYTSGGGYSLLKSYAKSSRPDGGDCGLTILRWHVAALTLSLQLVHDCAVLFAGCIEQ
jgi:hypothetical protein